MSDVGNAKAEKLNQHSSFGNPFYHWLSGHCKKFLVLFAQKSIGNCLNNIFFFQLPDELASYVLGSAFKHFNLAFDELGRIHLSQLCG